MRDLAWACFSPPLVHIGQLAAKNALTAACTPRFTRARSLWLQTLDNDPAALMQHLSEHPTRRLGIYFEQLWHFFLRQDPEYELLAHNLPVRDAARTLGEFDCIVYNQRQRRHIHLELAVKFFLGTKPQVRDAGLAGSAHDWLGPDRKDRLSTKLDQLLQRQIWLGDTPAARPVLSELGISDLARQIVLKGYLFQPTGSALPLPPAYNTACPLSLWVTSSALDRHCAALAASAFAILPKRCWLSTAYCDTRAEWLSCEQLQDAVTRHLEGTQYPLLIAALDARGAESSRFFVTPQDWPSVC